MSVKMFVYLNKSSISKTIAKFFNVKKLTKVGVEVINKDRIEGFGYICGSYSPEKNTIVINTAVWELMTEYERYELFIHEMIHAYQHAYSLCDFAYGREVEYEKRPQEQHAELYTKTILKIMNIIETEKSVFEYGREIS